MKKIILAIFLMLGVVAFAAPSHVNEAKIKQEGHRVFMDKDSSYSFIKEMNNSLLAITYFVRDAGDIGELGNAKAVSEALKNKQIAQEGIEYIGSGETETGYIHKLYSADEGIFFYIVIGKNQKIKSYIVTGILQTTEEYSSKRDLKKVINLAIDEGESYLK